MAYEFKLPDVGEGLHEGEIVKWHVKEGELVQENQPLVDVLTDKATVEIPSPKTGKILKLLAQPGQKVRVGEGLIQIETPDQEPRLQTHDSQLTTRLPTGQAGNSQLEVLATPAVRKLAKDLGVDLSKIKGTGPQGRITEEDLHKTGPEERIPLRGIRRKTAEKMSFSKKTVAHVTHADEADATALVALREELKPEAEKKGIKLTYLSFILKALTKALKEFPSLNASLDDQREEIVLKRYYNIGIATATEHGLFNPVIKEADKKDIWNLAQEVERLSNAARKNQISLSDLQASTFTITNIGPIGGLFATPVVVHPETAILGVMKIQKRPIVRDNQVVIRDMLNLCLSFDHRVLDGAEAAMFMNTLIKHLENPRTLLN
ncbi:MAG: 2-oxo acid dehydrogenase subunit E2 [Elusimicrobia bacterium]|nr:2-oxo acid dehydrogenase subunit E2 [Elusimicrobiota bacterium]